MLPNIDIACFQSSPTFSSNPWDKQHVYHIFYDQFHENAASAAKEKKKIKTFGSFQNG